MCIEHKPELLKLWRSRNRDKKAIVAYKVIITDNRSIYSPRFTWSVGKHKVVVQKLIHNPVFNNSSARTGRGFYAYLNKKDAFYIHDSSYYKVIVVHVDPKDVVYMGYVPNTDCRAIICRRLEIKSLEGII